ncbi:hypothetical protein MATL_G00226980 [Megalops atlanticus]|uniref:Uncharacterized protein n=1 Tax=Megalops atlanticus TaxID=7932 RepID=A0A9D3T3F4_MEGAT|nr:hypothetical protein MATL_G00226980 [Megalops atlanticus]
MVDIQVTGSQVCCSLQMRLNGHSLVGGRHDTGPGCCSSGSEHPAGGSKEKRRPEEYRGESLRETGNGKQCQDAAATEESPHPAKAYLV